MKSILMSIQPYYSYLEMKGLKTIEVRKTLPKSKDWSGKVKVYVSQNKKSFNRIPKEDREWFSQYLGKVAYEFICDYVEKEAVAFTEMGNLGRLYHCRLSLAELKKYAGERTSLYYWHISALKVYDKPRELGEFYGYNKELEKRFLGGENYCCYDAKNEYGEAMTECDGENIKNCYRCWEEWSGWCHRITRPPQSWQYVEEVEEWLKEKKE